MTKNIEGIEAVIKFIYEKMQYAEFNTKSYYCSKCGFDGEIQLNEEQLNYLRELKNKKKAKSIFYFASESEIKTLGVDYTRGKYKAFIGAHTRLLLDDYKGDL